MFIIAFEGIDKSGKETQARMLAEHIRNIKPVVPGVMEVAFPRYETETGKRIREVLMGNQKATPLQLAKLFEIDRYNFFENDISSSPPSLLIADRYIMSNTFALSRGVDEIDLMWLQHGLPAAHLHIFVDVPVEVSLKRSENYLVTDTFEQDKALLQATRDRYLAYAEAGHYYDKGKVVRIDGDQSVEEVHKDILNAVYPVLFGMPFPSKKEAI